MQVVADSVGRVAQAWDEQHLDLQAASEQIVHAEAGGFSDGVRVNANRFLSAWERHTGRVASRCEAQADGLRSTIRDYLETDAVVTEEYFRLTGYLAERR